jgi:hypothetical protein
MRVKHGVRQKVVSSCVEKVGASDFVCYNGGIIPRLWSARSNVGHFDKEVG